MNVKYDIKIMNMRWYDMKWDVMRWTERFNMRDEYYDDWNDNEYMILDGNYEILTK